MRRLTSAVAIMMKIIFISTHDGWTRLEYRSYDDAYTDNIDSYEGNELCEDDLDAPVHNDHDVYYLL